MNMRTLMRTTGAALLTAALGMTWSGSAHALKFVSTAGATPMTDDAGSITYAKETLRSDTDNVQEAIDDADTTTYYGLTRDHHVAAALEVAGDATDVYILTYDLSGMVFGGSAIVATPSGFDHAAGGMPGDNYVVFRPNADVAATLVVGLTAKFAVSASGGSLTMTAQNRTLEDILGGGRATKKHDPVSIRVLPALIEMVKVAEITAKANLGFKGFDGSALSPILHGELGSIRIDVAGAGLSDTSKQFLDARGDGSITDNTVTQVMDVMNGAVGITVGGGDPLNNTAVVDGETSFVEKIGFGTTLSCGASGPAEDIRKPTEDDLSVYTDEFIVQDALKFAVTDSMSLCILADGVTPILKGQYTIATTYKGIEDAAFPPNDGATKVHLIGTIVRDGAEFQIPFLSVNEKFKQRLNIVNRGSETTYALGELRTLDTATVAARAMAEGTLDASSHMAINVADLIDVSGASRASGTLSMPTDSTSITVSLDIVNPESGAIDTVILIADD